jgi:urocanate hydratase
MEILAVIPVVIPVTAVTGEMVVETGAGEMGAAATVAVVEMAAAVEMAVVAKNVGVLSAKLAALLGIKW